LVFLAIRHPEGRRTEVAVKRVAGSTREAILAAGAAEFAAHGFAGASVDDIAARSGFNKAMIYYHFSSKQGLYLEVLRDVFRAMGARTGEIAASDGDPGARIGAFIDALDEMATRRPYMPPMMMREMAEGATRLDVDTLRLMAHIFDNLRLILEDGARQGVFRPVNPLLTYLTLLSPVIFFHASAPVRAALQKSHVVDTRKVDPPAFVANLKAIALSALSADAPTLARRRPRSARRGDRA
jgi:TetR/AcrR family transcriptional regulator